jgi:monoterpene epsilon-lactone hydrolase
MRAWVIRSALTLSVTTSAEVLLDDAIRMAHRTREAGTEVSRHGWDEMIHVWRVLASIVPEGQQAMERVGEFIRTHLH